MSRHVRVSHLLTSTCPNVFDVFSSIILMLIHNYMYKYYFVYMQEPQWSLTLKLIEMMSLSTQVVSVQGCMSVLCVRRCLQQNGI